MKRIYGTRRSGKTERLLRLAVANATLRQPTVVVAANADAAEDLGERLVRLANRYGVSFSLAVQGRPRWGGRVGPPKGSDDPDAPVIIVTVRDVPNGIPASSIFVDEVMRCHLAPGFWDQAATHEALGGQVVATETIEEGDTFLFGAQALGWDGKKLVDLRRIITASDEPSTGADHV